MNPTLPSPSRLASAIALSCLALLAGVSSAAADVQVGRGGPVVEVGGIIGSDGGVPNDEPTGAITLPPGVDTIYGSNVGATFSQGEPSCGDGEGSTVWYRYTFPADKYVHVTATGYAMDLSLAIVGAGDDGSFTTGFGCIDPVAGYWWTGGPAYNTQTFFLRVGGFHNSQGAFQLSFAVADQPAGTGVCFAYNPAALTNLCVGVGESIPPLPLPGIGSGSLCIVGPVCVPVPTPVIGPLPPPLPSATLDGYVEATVACGLLPNACRVDL